MRCSLAGITLSMLLLLPALCTAWIGSGGDDIQVSSGKGSKVERGDSERDEASEDTDIEQSDFPRGFIKVFDTGFVDEDCREYVPSGWNSWNRPLLIQAMVAAAGEQWGADYVHDLFSEAQDMGFNVVRLFGFGLEEEFVLQPGPGVYNESIWQGFDFLLDVASQYNIRILWAITTNWQETDSPWAIADWADIDIDDFWVDEDAKQMFKDHISVLVNRVNTINNMTYREDPTIFAWDLYNEMRCPQNQSGFSLKDFCIPAINKWIEEMSAHLKYEDPYHLLTVGNEGFFGYDSPYEYANPSGTPPNVLQGWGGYIGQDFLSNHASPDIDFMSFHMWPDNWWTLNLTWGKMWLDAHTMAARELGKPVILEEYGKRTYPGQSAHFRDPWYNLVHNYVIESIKANDYFKGDIFWYWDPFNWVVNNGQSKDNRQPLPPAANVVQPTDTTYKLVEQHTKDVRSITGNWRGSACNKALEWAVYPKDRSPAEPSTRVAGRR